LYQAVGRPEAAARELAELIRLAPRDVEARLRLARLRMRQGHHKAAAELLGDAVARAPDDLRVHLSLARALLHSGRTEEATAAAEAARRVAPSAAAPRILLADCRVAQGRLDAAAALLVSLAEDGYARAARERLALVRLRQRRFEAAEDAARQATASGPPRPLTLGAVAVAAQGRGRYAAAAAACRRLREVHGEVGAFLLAQVWLAKGDRDGLHAVSAAMPDRASQLAAAYDELLDRFKGRDGDRREVALLLSLGMLYQRAGWHGETREAFAAAWELAPRSLLVGELLAKAHRMLGQEAEQIDVWETLAKAHPESTTAARVLTRLYMARQQPGRAESTARAILDRSPQDLEAHRLLSLLALRRGDHGPALEHARTAFRGRAEHTGAYEVLLDVLLARGACADAAQAVEAHLAAAPDAVRRPLERAIEALGRGDVTGAQRQVKVGVRRAPFDPRVRYVAGLAMERAGELDQALAHYEAAALARPWYPAARLRLARVALRLGKTERALAVYRDLARNTPGLVEAQVGVADALSAAGRHGDAAAALRPLARSLAREGGASWRAAQARLAREHLAMNNLTRAVATADAVLREQPDHPVARQAVVEARRRLGDLAGAARVYERVAARVPEAGVDAELGVLRLLQRDFAAAAARLERASAAGGARAELSVWCAASHIALGRTDEARAAVERAMGAGIGERPPSLALVAALAAAGAEGDAARQLDRLRQDDPDLAGWLAKALPDLAADQALVADLLASTCAAAEGWPRQAATLAAAARERQPDSPLLLYVGALRCIEAGAMGPALSAARKLARLRPEDGLSHFMLGRVLLAREEPEAAAEAFEKAEAALPKTRPGAWATMAQSLAAAGKIGPAIRAYETVLDLQPDYAAACNNLAWLYARHRPDRLDKAEQMARRAVQADARSAAFHDTLGWVLFLRDKLAEARTELKAANELAPNTANYLYHLGMVHFALDQAADARRLLQRALALDLAGPDAETARQTLKLLGAKAPPGKTP
ncbi:MAG: tetratricopeptide repeat protein, partial [Planctomycetota bacterium]